MPAFRVAHVGQDDHQAGPGRHRGQRDIDEPADGEHPLRGDGLGQLGHHLAADQVHIRALPGGRRNEFGVAGLRGGRDEQLRHHAAGGERLAHRLRALRQERPGALPEARLASWRADLTRGERMLVSSAPAGSIRSP